MKKALLLLTIFVLLLLAACGKAASAAETPAPTETPIPAETYAPAETPVPTADPTPCEAPEVLTLPRLTLISNAGKTEALFDTAHWTYRNGKGEDVTTDKIPLSRTDNFQDTDWYSLDNPFLYADGEVSLSFNMREPKNPKLSAFTSLGMVPVELEDWTFTPYAGRNTYVLTCTWDWTKEEGGGSCRYILLIEGAETNAPAGTERDDLRLTVTSADAYGCAFTLENLGTRWPYQAEVMTDLGDPFALLRRTEAGGWEWVKPIRTFQGGHAENLGSGETWDWAWDWSHSYGTLPAGDYALMLCGYTRNQDAAKETLYLRGEFTLTDTVPEIPGPLTLCEMPEGIETAMEQRSPHRWVQILSTEEQGWMAEADYALFRCASDGTLEYIPPEYHMPFGLNYPYWLLNGGSRTYDVDLAAQYGQLPAGTYVLRSRFLLRSEEERNYGARDRLWQLQPEDRVIYGDTVFTLRTSLWDVPREVDADEWYTVYTGEETNLLISTAGSVFDSTHAELRLENVAANSWYDVWYESDYCYLYFNYLGEWFPVEGKRYRSHGLMAGTVARGETRELDINFELWYGELEPGTYRMVISAGAEPAGTAAMEGPYRIVCQFKINADGSGERQSLEEAENLADTYSRELAARYRYDLDGDWFYVPGPTWSRDLSVYTWKLERQRDQLTVTVYRDLDYERAEALLGNYPNVEIIRGKDFTTPSPLRESNTRTDGVLSARVIEQEDPALEPAGTWLLSLTWNGKEPLELEPNAFRTVFVEEYDPEAEEWRRLPHDWGHIGPQWMEFIPLEPGKAVNVYIVNLGLYRRDLSRDKQYRFALLTDTQAGNGETLEYFLCPFRLEQYDKAATEEEVEALREAYPWASGYFMSENTLLGKPLQEYIARMMGPTHPEFDCFYAEVEYLGKGRPSESYLRDSIRVRIDKIVCGELDTLPERVLEEDGTVLLAVNMGTERDALPEFREGDRYLVLLCCWAEEREPWKEYANCLELCGGGEIYYLAEGEILLSTLYYREEYDGCSRLTFERLLRDLYAETLSRSGI